MSSKSQISLNSDILLFKQKVDYRQLPSTADRLISSLGTELRALILLSEKPLTTLIPKRIERRNLKYEEYSRTDNILSGRIEGRFGRKHPNEIEGAFYLIRHPDYPIVWILITDASGEFMRKPLKNFLNLLRPRCSTPILRTSELEGLLKTFEKDRSLSRIRVTEMGHRSRIRSSGAIKQVESDRQWTDLMISEAFSEAKESGSWVTDVTIEYEIGTQKTVQVKIGRFGEFSFKNHASTSFALLDRVSRLSMERYYFFKDRDRKKENNFLNKPFKIDFNYDLFDSKEQIKKLDTTLKQIPSTSCTVLHGNPYYHSVLMDFVDGSVYEILVVSNSNITVIPQGRSTAGALQRLCSHIFSHFREGEIKGD